MYYYLSGLLAKLSPGTAVIDCGGVGYMCSISAHTEQKLATYEGKNVKLYTHLSVREDAMELFGFFTKGERELFVMLMTVSGIGANTARMIMSAYSAAEIRQIIATGNARALSQVKGLGPKTAQRIIVDLKDKVLKIDLGNEAKGERLETMELLGEEASIVDSAVKQEAISALVMLGFAAAASGKVVDKILKAAPESSVEQVIKQALKML